MSLFQCDKCGCLENTSCSDGYHMGTFMEQREGRYDAGLAAAAASYREILGLKPDQPFGSYCSVCDPAWYSDPNTYGVGPRPADYKDKGAMSFAYHEGKWHGEFERTFLPKGMFHMNEDGNLAHILTLDTDVDKYALPAEEGLVLPPHFKRLPDHGLPRPSNKAECGRYVEYMGKMAEAVDQAPEHLRPKDEGERRAVLMHFANQIRKVEYEQQKTEQDRKIRAELKSSAASDLRPLARRRGRTPTPGVLAMAAAAIGMGHMPTGRLHREEAKPPTPEERAADAARSQAKLAAADKKRAMRAAKRAKVSAQSQQARSSD